MKKTAYFAIKRVFDVFFSFLGIVVTSPAWLAAIIGIELSDPGPVFFMANRVGKNNTPFRMFKFRSMRQGKANESVFRGEESRIFPFGGFIRKTKIDELPQLINILTGDMSIVGPRPAALDQMTITRGGKYAKAGDVPAGLTGPSALYDYIYGDSVEDAEAYEKLVLPTRMELDLVYLEKMSIGFDLKMIIWTVKAIFDTLMNRKQEKTYQHLIQWAAERQ